MANVKNSLQNRLNGNPIPDNRQVDMFFRMLQESMTHSISEEGSYKADLIKRPFTLDKVPDSKME